MTLERDELLHVLESCAGCGVCGSIGGLYSASCPPAEFFKFESYQPWGMMVIGKAIVEGRADFTDARAMEKIYSCTTCGNCEVQCGPRMRGRFVAAIEELRAQAVQKDSALPAHRDILKALSENSNIYNKPRSQRADWLKNMKVKLLPAQKARVLYFSGCASSLDPLTQTLARSTVRLLTGIGVDLGVLADGEECCGSPALRIGDRETFMRLAAENIEAINKTGVETVVTSCAECLKTLRDDYPEGLKPEVVHTSEYLDRLLWNDEFAFTREVHLTAAYHDPCYLGRHAGVFESPRRVLGRIPGVVLREMERTKENSFCCGSGGGVGFAFPELTAGTAGLRLAEAEATGASHLVTACPFCFQSFSKAIRETGSKMKLMDMVQLAGQAI